jgi:hypothetical protein
MGSLLALRRSRRGEPPAVPFKISRPIFALSIRLIDGLRVNTSTCGSRLFVVCVDIVHVHKETRISDVGGPRGIELVFRHHTVQPDGGFPRANLAVNGLALGVPVYTSAAEAERHHQEIVSSSDVLISQNRNDLLEICHDVYPITSA